MRIAIAILSLFPPLATLAGPMSGMREVALFNDAGDRYVIADIEFPDTGNGSYQINWREDLFTDHFLSMRPFRCLDGDKKIICRVPYPYENKRSISNQDLTDLEYDLLFVWKGATDYGINLWNGMYFRLHSDGDRLVGDLHELDMNLLAAPPVAGNLRPIGESDLHPADLASHWLPQMAIE